MNYKTYSNLISETKAIELSIHFGDILDLNEDKFLETEFKKTEKCDHAGIRFWFKIKNLFSFEIEYYDIRHWNHEKDRWYKTGEEFELYLRSNEYDLQGRVKTLKRYFYTHGWDHVFENQYGITLEKRLSRPNLDSNYLGDLFRTFHNYHNKTNANLNLEGDT